MATNPQPVIYIPTWTTAAIGTVMFIGTVWKFFIRNPFEDKLREFNRRKDDLKGSRETLKTRMHKQLETPGKVVQADVKKWLDAADREISEDQSVEYLAAGILYYLFPRYGIVKKRSDELKKTFEDGEKFRDMPAELLVDDDASLKWFKEQKKKLKVKLGEVGGRLSSQLVPGKIETEEVKVWRGKVDQIINGQATKDIETKFSNVPQEPEFSNLVKQKIREMEELRDEGARLSESLVGDDYSQTLSDDEMQKFKEWKEKLKGKCQDVERISQLQLRLGMIETEQVKIWKKQVAETTASAVGVQNQLDRGPPYTAPLVGRVIKMIPKMEKLHDDECKLPESLVIPDPSASAPPLLVPVLQGSASDAVKEEILGHLRGDGTSKIGVWGMAGVGKT